MIFTGVFSTFANDGLKKKGQSNRMERITLKEAYFVTGNGLKLRVRLRTVVVDVFILIILRFLVNSCCNEETLRCE